MTTIRIDRPHELPQDACDDALGELTDYLQGLGARVRRSGDALTFNGNGFEGDVCIKPGTAQGRIKLGLLARPFRHQIESAINEQLDARLDD